MAGLPVSGASIGLAAAVPAGLTAASTNAEKVTACELLTFTKPASCIVLQLPSFEEFWDTGQDEPTVCDNPDEILSEYKINQKITPSSLSAYFDKGDPLIQLFIALQKSRSDVGTIEFTHSNGTDKIWAQVEITKVKEDPTETTGKVKFMAEFFFKRALIRN